MPLMTHEEFLELPLERLEAITGVPAPDAPTPELERAYRDEAWESYKVDVANEEEWGGVEPDPA
jgi:hypothetical protein